MKPRAILKFLVVDAGHVDVIGGNPVLIAAFFTCPRVSLLAEIRLAVEVGPAVVAVPIKTVGLFAHGFPNAAIHRQDDGRRLSSALSLLKFLAYSPKFLIAARVATVWVPKGSRRQPVLLFKCSNRTIASDSP